MTFSPRILLTLIALISVASGCSEPTQPAPPEIVRPTPPAAPPAPVVPVNTAPTAYVGWDIWVPLPANSSILDALATDAESSISYLWKKVSGPKSYSIESPDSLQTKVVNLQEGTYQFELTVTDKGGLTGKATVRVVVYEPRTPGANEFIFKDLRDSCGGQCDRNFSDRFTYVIENFHAYVPAGTASKVLLKVAGSTNWIEVSSTEGEDYVYRINGNRFVLEIDADNRADQYRPVDVKITF